MPNVRAISAAVTGAISPRLFEPSVRRMITFDLAWLSLMRLTALASPTPMAVPSSIMPLWMSLKRFSSTAWSVVRGHWVKLSPEKTTRPMLSFGRPLMKLAATFLAAVSRSGRRSRASILPEMSMAIIMSMPSVEEFCQLSVDCGRARMTITSAMATMRSTKGRWRRRTLAVVMPFTSNASDDDISMLAWLRRSFHTYAAISGTMRSNKNK